MLGAVSAGDPARPSSSSTRTWLNANPAGIRQRTSTTTAHVTVNAVAPGLEQLEVFALLPRTYGLGHLGADRLLEAVDLVLLDGHQVVDEGVPEAGPVETILPENGEGLPECGGQHRSVGLGVGLVAHGRRIELLGDPVVPGGHLGCQVEVGVGGGFADAVLDMGRRVVGVA